MCECELSASLFLKAPLLSAQFILLLLLIDLCTNVGQNDVKSIYDAQGFMRVNQNQGSLPGFKSINDSHSIQTGFKKVNQSQDSQCEFKSINE